MTVQELIERLEKMPQDAEVGLIYKVAYFPIGMVYISEHHLLKDKVIIE